MKKLCIRFVFLAFAFTLCACSTKHYDENNISELYDSNWIIGKSRDQIENKYGEFDREYVSDTSEIIGAYYVNYDNAGLDPSFIHDTFFVIFNDADVAVDAYFEETSIGG